MTNNQYHKCIKGRKDGRLIIVPLPGAKSNLEIEAIVLGDIDKTVPNNHTVSQRCLHQMLTYRKHRDLLIEYALCILTGRIQNTYKKLPPHIQPEDLLSEAILIYMDYISKHKQSGLKMITIASPTKSTGLKIPNSYLSYHMYATYSIMMALRNILQNSKIVRSGSDNPDTGWESLDNVGHVYSLEDKDTEAIYLSISRSKFSDYNRLLKDIQEDTNLPDSVIIPVLNDVFDIAQ